LQLPADVDCQRLEVFGAKNSMDFSKIVKSKREGRKREEDDDDDLPPPLEEVES
jgi:hypothetical protein